jgi:hypothetical protein
MRCEAKWFAARFARHVYAIAFSNNAQDADKLHSYLLCLVLRKRKSISGHRRMGNFHFRLSYLTKPACNVLFLHKS